MDCFLLCEDKYTATKREICGVSKCHVLSPLGLCFAKIWKHAPDCFYTKETKMSVKSQLLQQEKLVAFFKAKSSQKCPKGKSKLVLSEKTPLLKSTKLEVALAPAELSLVSLNQSEKTPGRFKCQLTQNSESFHRLTKTTLCSTINLSFAPCLI